MDYRISNRMKELKPSAIREIFKSLTDPAVIPFAAGNPAAESFPTTEMSEISAAIFADPAVTSQALQYGITEGYTPLRTLIAGRNKARFNFGREFDTTIITSGGQQGIDLTCKVLCNEGDVILCEEPSFIGSLNSFRSHGAKLVGVPMEDDGISLEGLEQAMQANKNAKILYIIPNFQNPTGITLPLYKRKAVYEMAKNAGMIILEDNPYGELRFAGQDIPTIKSMDEDGIVVYCSSFSKILSAGMRVGFLVAPDALMQKIVVAKQTNDVHTNLFFQMICARYMEHYDLDAQIQKVRNLYGKKCRLMLNALDKHMDKRIDYTRPEGGLFIWCRLPNHLSTAPLVKLAMERKVAIVPGEAFLSDSSGVSDGFRLNYSTPTEEQITRGIELLADAVAHYLQ